MMTPRRDERLYRLVRLAARMVLAPGFRLEVSGTEKIPTDSAYVLLPKHQRWQDIPLLGMCVPKPLYFVAKHGLFAPVAAGWFFKRLGGIPLNRERPLESRRYLSRVVRVLERAEGLVVFPEGTYCPGAVGPPKTGVVRFVLNRLALPFIPVGIHYYPNGLRTRAAVRFGDPLLAEPSESGAAFVARIMGHIARLSDMEENGASSYEPRAGANQERNDE
ncbi:MAG: lysophospholipid acyltransferase family protein [Pseudomonadota bacterium]